MPCGTVAKRDGGEKMADAQDEEGDADHRVGHWRVKPCESTGKSGIAA
jgi:hypothetical protein